MTTTEPFEMVAVDCRRDSRLIAVAGRGLIECNEELIREARDNLDAALAKIAKVTA